MAVAFQTIHLSPLVYYDVYDEKGILLALQQGILLALDEQETLFFNQLLAASDGGDLQADAMGEKESANFLERLRSIHIITPHPPTPLSPLPASMLEQRTPPARRPRKSLWRERLRGGGAVLCVLNELRISFYRAYQYLHVLEQQRRDAFPFSEDDPMWRANQSYWVYRLVASCFERKVAYLLGQQAGEEGLCLVKSFALCAYLLSVGIAAQVVIARPKYGSQRHFTLHAWVEVEGRPVNEHPNIHDGFRIICLFPAQQN